MSNQWLRLWHDMPNDPKWRTIARVSKQRIGDVLAVYMHLLTAASQHVTRGHADVTPEDLASALDVTEDVIQAILTAMQGRVLDGDLLTGWEKRQPKREDPGSDESGAKSAAERKREQREREKAASIIDANKSGHDASRNVTIDKEEEKDKDKDTEKKTKTEAKARDFEKFWSAYPKKDGKKDALNAWAKVNTPIETILSAIEKRRNTDDWTKSKGQFVPLPATWLNGKRWEDELANFGSFAPTTTRPKYSAAAAAIFDDEPTYHPETIDV